MCKKHAAAPFHQVDSTLDFYGAGESGTSYDNASFEDDSSYNSDGLTNSSSDAATNSDDPESGSFSEADESIGDSFCSTTDSFSSPAAKSPLHVQGNRAQECNILRCETGSSDHAPSCCDTPPGMHRPPPAAAAQTAYHRSDCNAPSARSPTRGRKHGAAAAGHNEGHTAACGSQCRDKACPATDALEEAQQSVEAREEEVACLHEALRKTAERARGLEVRLGDAVQAGAIGSGGNCSSKCKHCDVVQGQLEVTSIPSILQLYLHVFVIGMRSRGLVGGQFP